MTEDQWVRADDSALFVATRTLGPRRERLLASAVCRALGDWASDPAAAAALEVNDRFADTGKTKVGLKRAREALQTARIALGEPPPPGTDARRRWEGTYLALRAVGVACTESASPGAITEAVRTLREGEGLTVEAARRRLYPVYRDFDGPPPSIFDPRWRTTTAAALARRMYESRDFGPMPILADALEDAGCDSAEVLAHCRGDGPHARGCWVADLVLGKS